MKQKQKNKGKSINLALYFGILVFFIIIVSVVFKVFDVVGKSRFDGEHRFTVAILNDKNIELVSVSPKDGSITKLTVKNTTSVSDLEKFYIPIDSFVDPKNDLNADPGSVFLKLLLNRGVIKKDLTILDLFRLGIFSKGISSEKIVEESVSLNDEMKISRITTTLFIDPTVQEEKVSIQITNSTNISGLGNNLAKYITSMGGTVVLVNSSSNPEKKSKIIYENDSYTVKKLAENLKIPKEKREGSPISEVLLIIGEDREGLLTY